MFQRLLVAIDGSLSGDVAIDFATAVALRSSASVHVFFANERLVGHRGLLLRDRSEATDLITDSVSRLREVGVAATGSVRPCSYRDVAASIADEAQRRNADAIVLGSRRKRRVERLFASQVRERTTRLTALPVLIAPSPLEVARGLGRSGSEFGLDATFNLEELLRTSR